MAGKENPIDLFKEWFEKAKKTEPDNPEAVAVATSTPEGVPSVRYVLLKGYDERGFVFYTNLGSQKSQELISNPNIQMCFYWKSLKRQVRIAGRVEAVSNEEADTYFSSRPRISKIGAWASKQSQPLEGYFELEKRVAQFTAKFNFGEIPRPEFWSGYRVIPEKIEFWQEKPFRLHDRFVFKKIDNQWEKQWLFP